MKQLISQLPYSIVVVLVGPGFGNRRGYRFDPHRSNLKKEKSEITYFQIFRGVDKLNVPYVCVLWNKHVTIKA